MHSDAKRRAFGYVRVSTDHQAEQGDSLAVQAETLKLLCQLEGYDLVAVYSDPGTSGSVPFAKRDGGKALLEAASPGDVIVATKLDRAFRNAFDALGTLRNLKKGQIGLHLRDLGSVTDSAVSAMIFAQLSAVAEFEVARRSERIREVKASHKTTGRFLGGEAPLGYTVEIDPTTLHLPKPKKMIVVDAEAHNLARQLRAQGYSARAAAGAMKAHGYKASDKSVSKLWATLDQSTAAVGYADQCSPVSSSPSN